MLVKRSVTLLLLAALALAGCSRGGDLAKARGLSERAMGELERAQSLVQQGNTGEANLAAISAEDGLRNARDAYLSARADRSRDVDVLVEFAQLCERLEDFDLAGEAYARAAQTARERPDLWFRASRNFVSARGRYLDRASDALAAAEAANATAEAPVAAADLAVVHGDLFMVLGLPEDAAARYAEALESDPQHARGRIGAMGAALELGDAVRAAAMVDSFTAPTQGESILLDRTLRTSYQKFRRDRVIVPETAESMRSLARLSVRLGFLQEARLAIERAVQLDDADVFAWNLLGSLAHQSGEIARARTAFERSLAIQPDQPRTKQALDELRAAN